MYVLTHGRCQIYNTAISDYNTIIHCMDVRIGTTPVGKGHPVFFVAEIGINHNGDMAITKRLIDVAVESGCNAVKFQKRTVPIVYTEEELARPREVHRDIILSALQRNVLPPSAIKRLEDSDLTQTTNGDLKWALELTLDEYKEIDQYCQQKGILWFASPWDEASVDFFDAFDSPCYKIASASLTDTALLLHIRSKGKLVILSTGMSTMEQTEKAVSILGENNLILLHCVSTYPAEHENINLQIIHTLYERFPNCVIGYSGHERGLQISLAAAAMGASVIERHLTLDRTMWGSDHAASLEPKGIQLLIRDIRTLELAWGDGVKKVLPQEMPIIEKLRRKKDF